MTEALATAPRCAGCGVVAPHLRSCGACRSVAYCSTDCQRKHWRAGHKRECAALAAQRRGG